uniref:Uncharacterized protein n=1 Tax=Zea mays TaxID=4577 RepID=B7ZZ98_MAIZE|nr:unknown [Zea mays]
MLRKLSKSDRGNLISCMSSGNIMILTSPPLSIRLLAYWDPTFPGSDCKASSP